MRISTCAVQLVTSYGARQLRYCPNTIHHAIWRQCLSNNCVGGADGALTPARNEPSFTPRRSRKRDKSAYYMAMELCACARAMDSSRGGVQRDVTANPRRLPFNILSCSWAQFTPVSVRSVTPASGRSPDRLSMAGHSAC
jgi:hypothetical protein